MSPEEIKDIVRRFLDEPWNIGMLHSLTSSWKATKQLFAGPCRGRCKASREPCRA